MNSALEDVLPPIEQTIAYLADVNQPLHNARLAGLSDLDKRQLSLLTDALPGIEVKRRCQIISRLAELAEDDVCLNFDGIFKNSLKDDNERVRITAIEGLWENEETSLIVPLIDLMNNDSSEKARAAAARALGRFAMLAEHRKIPREYTGLLSRALLDVYADSNRSIDSRRRALESAASLSSHEVKQAISEAYRSGSPLLKISAIYAMGKNCDPIWLPILLSGLADSNSEIRYESAEACGELGEQEAVPQLIGLINDGDADVQMAVVQALGKIGGSEAREQLKKCLNHPSEAILQAAAQALHELEIVTEPLHPHFMDEGDQNG